MVWCVFTLGIRTVPCIHHDWIQTVDRPRLMYLLVVNYSPLGPLAPTQYASVTRLPPTFRVRVWDYYTHYHHPFHFVLKLGAGGGQNIKLHLNRLTIYLLYQATITYLLQLCFVCIRWKNMVMPSLIPGGRGRLGTSWRCALVRNFEPSSARLLKSNAFRPHKEDR